MTRQRAPAVRGRVGVSIEVDDPDAPRSSYLGDRRRGRPGDRMVAAQDDRDSASLGDLTDLAVDHRVAAFDPRGNDVGVAGIHHGQDVQRLDVELERVDGATRVLRIADRPRPEPGARPMADGVVERCAHDGHVHLESAQFGWVRDPGQFHECGRPDVGRQVEVVERLVRRIPAVVGREATIGRRIVGALSHGGPPGGRGAPPVRVGLAGRASAMVAPGVRAYDPSRNSCQAAFTRAGSANRS